MSNINHHLTEPAGWRIHFKRFCKSQFTVSQQILTLSPTSVYKSASTTAAEQKQQQQQQDSLQTSADGVD
jgi:hypothetical protein